MTLSTISVGGAGITQESFIGKLFSRKDYYNSCDS